MHLFDGSLIPSQPLLVMHSQTVHCWSHKGTNTNCLDLPLNCRAASLGPEDGALHRPVPRQAPPLPQIKRQDVRPSAPPPTRRRDPRSRRGYHQDEDAANVQAAPTRPSRDYSEPVWGGLSRSMSDGAAAQAWRTESPDSQVCNPSPLQSLTRTPLRMQAAVSML